MSGTRVGKPQIELARLQQVIDRCAQLTIGLVGDLFLDRYLDIDPLAREISVETDLETYQISSVRNFPGALGTVMNNLAALGVKKLVPVTVIGDDGHGYDLLQQLRSMPIDETHILRRHDRLTPTYTKPLAWTEAGEWTELNRIDVRSRTPLSSDCVTQLCSHLEDASSTIDGLIVLDQIPEPELGVIGGPVREFLRDWTRRHHSTLVFVDSRTELEQFDFGVLKGNRSEILKAAGLSGGDDQATQEAVAILSQRTGNSVFCTLGENGILVAANKSTLERIPGIPVTGPIDIVGAGDSVTSGIVLSLLCGCDEIESAAVGNLVASITVQQLATTGTATPEKLVARWHEVQGS